MASQMAGARARAGMVVGEVVGVFGFTKLDL